LRQRAWGAPTHQRDRNRVASADAAMAGSDKASKKGRPIMIEVSLFATINAGNCANVMIAPAYHIFPKNQAISPDMITDNG
jgi:hypothetical protein